MICLNDYEVGQHRIECPSCGRGGRDKTAGLKVQNNGSSVLHCFRCLVTESFVSDSRQTGHRAPCIKLLKFGAQQYQKLSEWGKRLWFRTQELDGLAVQYLQSRYCCLPPIYGDLRWHPSLKHPSGHVGPALVALITDALTNEPLSLHRTWITATGKANIENPRLVLGNHATARGVIRLWPDDEVTGVLGIAEGIETALSLAHAPMPVWATIDAGHMAKFPALPGIETLIIAVDNDPAGLAAATSCADGWVDAGKTVMLTAQTENDLNDSLREASLEY